MPSAALASACRSPGGGGGGGARSEKKALQERLDEATLALDRVEEERDVALLELERREDALAAREAAADELRARLAAAERHLAGEGAERRRAAAAAAAEGEAAGEVLEDRRRRQELANEGLEIKLRRLSNQHHFLETSVEERKAAKEEVAQLLSSTLDEISRLQRDCSEVESEAQRLRQSRGALKEEAAADVYRHDHKLREAKQQNVETLQLAQQSQVREHRVGQDLFTLRQTLSELRAQRDAIRARLEVRLLNRLNQTREEARHRKDALEHTVEALGRSLASAEEQNAQLQDVGRTQRTSLGQMDDKVYALMDQVHQVQSKLCRQEQKAVDKDRKVGPLSRRLQILQDGLEREVNARLAAEQEARDAQQAKALVERKHGRLEDALQLAQSTQQKSERRLQDLVDKANSLQIKNDFMRTLIDGNEDDKGALRYELRTLRDRIQDETESLAPLLAKRRSREQQLAELRLEKASIIAELDYIRREDMLDEHGRLQPILIESESPLVDRLEINEFLFNAQMARKPVELLVLKISHLLEMLHRADVQAELFLQDIERSQEMLSSLRAKNLALFERVALSFSWRQHTLWRFAANAFEHRASVAGHCAKKDEHRLHLDGLQYHCNEIKELLHAIESYGQQDRVTEVSLQENQLDRPCAPALRALLEACPYLRRLDLRRNCLDGESIDLLRSYAEALPGCTGVEWEADSEDIRVMSGCQAKLVIAVADQSEPGLPQAAAVFEGDEALLEGAEDPRDVGVAADIFLASLSEFPAAIPDQPVPTSPPKPEQPWPATKRPPSSPALSVASTRLPSASASQVRFPTSPGMTSTTSSGFSTPNSISCGIGIGGGDSSAGGSPSAAGTPLPSLQRPRSTGKLTEISWLPSGARGQSPTSPLSPASTRASPSSLSSTPGRSPSTPLLPSRLGGRGTTAAAASSAATVLSPAARPGSSSSSRGSVMQASGRASAAGLPRSCDLKRTTFTFTSESGLVTGGSTQRWPKFQKPGGERESAASGAALATAAAAGSGASGSRVGTPSSEVTLPPLAGVAGPGGTKPLVQPACVADDDVIDL